MANKLVLEVVADVNNFLKGLMDAQRSLDNFLKGTGSSASGTNQSMSDLGVTIGKMAAIAGAAGTAISASFLTLEKTTADIGDHFIKLSEKTGIAVETLSALSYAAKLSDVDAEGMQKSLGRLARVMDGAEEGGKKAAAAFEYLHIETTTADGKLRPMGDLLLDVADRFSHMEDATKRAALAQQLFGRGGLDMIPMLQQGKEAIQASMDEAKRLGVVWSTDMASSAESFNENLKHLEAGVSGVSQQIGKAFLPVLAEVLHAMQPILETAVEWATWFDGLDAGVKRTVAVFAIAFAVGGPIVIAVGAVVTAIMLISSPLLIGGALILGLIAGAAAIAANWQALKDKTSGIWEELKGSAIVQWTELKVFVTQTVMNMVLDIGNWMGAKLQAAMDLALAPIQKTLDACMTK